MTTTATDEFLPTVDPGDWTQLSPSSGACRNARSTRRRNSRRWLLDLSALIEAIDEFGTRRYIDPAVHTDDPEMNKAFLHFVENIQPRIKPAVFELEKKYLACPFRDGAPFDGVRLRVLLERQWPPRWSCTATRTSRCRRN